MPGPPHAFEPFDGRHPDACADLYAAVFREPPWEEPWSVGAARERLARITQTPDSLGFVATRDGRRVGVILGCRRRQADGHPFEPALARRCRSATNDRRPPETRWNRIVP